MRYLVSTDTGGTFVDAVVSDELGRVHIGKASSTPQSPAVGMIGAVAAAAENGGLAVDEVLQNCRMFFNGTTVSTNAMIQRKGAKTGLLITKGFEDTLVIGRVKARWAGLDEQQITDYQHADRPAPIVPITLTRGVQERVDYAGNVIRALDIAEAEARIKELVDLGIEALAVCLLWSFKNPSHERAIRDYVREAYPNLYVVISSDLVPIIGEYERVNTTAINCILGPTLERYLTGIQEPLKEKGYHGEILVMQSIGGLAPAGELRRAAVTTLHSGPVGGIIAAQKLGELLGEGNIITADMGGTSFDVGMIVDGVPQSTSITVMDRNIVAVPAVEAISIGAGGGSAAWMDAASALRVGPQSMGANPGPACYGNGGTTPTVTDADVVLGYIDPGYFVGGKMRLYPELAVRSLQEHICRPLKMSLEEAAEGIYNIVNAHMADLMRKVSVERGHDPRNFTMVAFGGCGPTHSTAYGPDIGIGKVVVPQAATVFSALGIAQSDIKHFFSKTSLLVVRQNAEVDETRLDGVNATYAELLAQASDQLLHDGVKPEEMILIRSVDMRYKSQVHEINVPIGTPGPLSSHSLKALCEAFMRKYEMLYGTGSSSRQAAIELVTLHVDGIAPTFCGFNQVRHELVGEDPSIAHVGERKVWWGVEQAYVSTPIYVAEKLAPGNVVVGPALVVSYGTTIPLHPSQRLAVDQWLNLVITFP